MNHGRQGRGRWSLYVPTYIAVGKVAKRPFSPPVTCIFCILGGWDFWEPAMRRTRSLALRERPRKE